MIWIASGFVVYVDNELCGKAASYYTRCTNNFAELTAMRDALKFISEDKEESPSTIFTDSAYVCNGVNGYMYNWYRNSTILNRPNGELWNEIYGLMRSMKDRYYSVSIEKVKGHSDVEGNNIVDALVNQCVDIKHDISITI